MSNSGRGTSVGLEKWINHPSIQRGILSFYAGEPFDYDVVSPGYEIGRQIALLAKSHGLHTRGSILRRKANSQQMAIVKTKMTILHNIVYRELGFNSRRLAVY
jgi:hypothetical protein